MARKPRKTGQKNADDLAWKLDNKAYQIYKARVLESIREDLMKGMSADQILKKYEAHAAAALVSQMTDPKNAVAAAEKVLDRTQGKATQKIDSTHRYERLKDEELDALLTSRFTEIESDEDKKDVQ